MTAEKSKLKCPPTVTEAPRMMAAMGTEGFTVFPDGGLLSGHLLVGTEVGAGP